MESKEELEQLISLYQLTFPNEQPALTGIVDFIKHTEGDRFYDRKNFTGHITASAFVIDESESALLLIHHKKLDRWLQPGGHIDVADISIKDAAIRETVEETGIDAANLLPVRVAGYDGIFDIDSHPIPANINKNEPAHIHHDLRFVFSYTSLTPMAINLAEVHDFKWVPLQQLATDPTFGRIAEKVSNLLSGPPTDAVVDRLV